MNKKPKKLIRDLATQYYVDNLSGSTNAFEETWTTFEDLDLLSTSVAFSDDDLPSVMGASSDLVQLAVSSIVLGVVANAVYDTLKAGANRVAEHAQDNDWQENFINQLGSFSAEQKKIAQNALHWTLEQIKLIKRNKNETNENE